MPFDSFRSAGSAEACPTHKPHPMRWPVDTEAPRAAIPRRLSLSRMSNRLNIDLCLSAVVLFLPGLLPPRGEKNRAADAFANPYSNELTASGRDSQPRYIKPLRRAVKVFVAASAVVAR